ncbi:MAG: hypothetical protein NTV51_23575, partial [Verrucomicrobia bacterium]|nr:hypothetical protein [Verrucomicrobiota bacterium]
LASVFAAVSGFAGLANTASAGTDIHLNIGIGGRPGPVIVAPHYAPVPVAPVYGYGYEVRRAPDYRDCPPPAPRGYWKEIAVKVWVPAEWIVTRDRRGCEVRSLRPGYFTYRTDRVWVADAGPRGGYAYGRG